MTSSDSIEPTAGTEQAPTPETVGQPTPSESIRKTFTAVIGKYICRQCGAEISPNSIRWRALNWPGILCFVSGFALAYSDELLAGGLVTLVGVFVMISRDRQSPVCPMCGSESIMDPKS